jgi:hypothetical protein
MDCDNGGERRGFDELAERMDEQDFRRKSDAELGALKRRVVRVIGAARPRVEIISNTYLGIDNTAYFCYGCA